MSCYCFLFASRIIILKLKNKGSRTMATAYQLFPVPFVRRHLSITINSVIIRRTAQHAYAKLAGRNFMTKFNYESINIYMKAASCATIAKSHFQVNKRLKGTFHLYTKRYFSIVMCAEKDFLPKEI